MQLTQWGTQLRNCLGSYHAAAAADAAWLVGLEKGGRLVGCIEVSPQQRRIRQAFGPANRQLPGRLLSTATEMLVRFGVIRG